MRRNISVIDSSVMADLSDGMLEKSECAKKEVYDNDIQPYFNLRTLVNIHLPSMRPNLLMETI